MTQEQIVEGNKLIAEFIGWEYFGFNDPRLEGKYRPGWKKRFNAPQIEKLKERDFLCRTHNDLKYHRSWDWQIPVWSKWTTELAKKRMKAHPHKLDDHDYLRNIEIMHRAAVANNSLLDGFKALLAGITWYKSQNKINQ